MYLKALEIQGFKSFPDKTVLNFGEDITAIVGPNGSGKSNISDAIRWVMGEQSSKALRGGKMEDVIFGGTEKRAPVGFAQVTLVLDNTGHLFPSMDESEVAVTRRYYRSGESEYYINKQSVRLKDVNELFMDTGMGREGYSIIGQGKIDEILSVKSGERREVFEEAAGISKYRHRKEDSERKLERTEENLVRINDKIAELELQVEPLRQQAETAKKYLVLRDELRVLEISVWLEQLQDLRTARLKLESDTALAKAECDRAQQALDESYALGESFTEQMRQNDIQAETLRQQAGESDSAAGEESAAIAVLQTSIDHNNDSLRRLEQELTNADARRENLQGQIDAQLAHIADIDSSAAELGRELDALLAQAQALSDSARGAADEAESLRAQEAIAVAEAADGRAALSALNAALESADQRRTAVRQELTDAQTKLEGSEKEAKQNRRALNDAKEEAQAVQNIIQGHSLRMDSRRQKAEAAQAAKLELTMKVGAQDDRIRLLTEMEKEYEGFNKAVKIVMQAAEKNTLRGIHGPVAGLMTTKQEYAVALETALGGALQNIVVDREEDAKAAIQFLKQRDGGRATFLPLTAIRGDELRENVDGEYGFVGVASRLVRYDSRYDNIFRNLLGRTVVVEDLDSGIALARKFRSAFRIVTLDGQIINRGGSMTGGSVSRSSGVLSRANELERLTKAQGALHDRLNEAAQQAETAQRELQKAEYELQVAKEQQRKAEDDVLTLQGKQDHYDILLESLRLSCETMERELADIDSREKDSRTRAAEQQAAIDAAEERAAQLRRSMQDKLTGQTDLTEQTNRLAQAVSDKKAAQAALSAEKDGALRSVEDLKGLQADMVSDRAERDELAQRYRQANEKAAAEMAQHQASLTEHNRRTDTLRQKLEQLAQAKLELEQQRDRHSRDSRQCNDALLNAMQAHAKLQQKLDSSGMEESQILEKLWERYELSHSDAMEQRIELESVPKATRRIAELNREIKSLGTPNIGAIEEFDRVNTRYTYLSEQRSDVEQAKEELLGIIDQITQQMTEIFAQQFQLLNESFQETFLELFGGGKARLELEDESDILNCGIEIKVQPPGKQLKTITLLSGGEKAFVAIALYFAILKVHPTPFCVMDEIEAALDEANVVRYARYMRRIAGKTQFIVITHRRGTMEEADVLYGVTMQEKGVSRILTINLNDMAKELHIK